MKYSGLKLIKLVTIAVAASFLSTGLYAGKNSTLTGSLELLSPDNSSAVFLVDGEETNALPATWPTYGDQVAFDVQVDGRVDKNSQLFVRLVCRTGGSAIYQAVQVAPSEFIFDLDFEQWKDWATECSAELVYRVEKGKNRIDNYLDTASFSLN